MTAKCFSCSASSTDVLLSVCKKQFSFSWSGENLQIIMVYIPAQNRAKMQIAEWVC